MAINELRQRVERRLKELGIGAVEAARPVVGLERNYIRDLLENKKESFSQSKAALVAQALRWSVAELNGTAKNEPTPPKVQNVPLMDRVPAGKLAAPMSQLPVEDVPLLAFADLGRGDFIALTVEGDSMDRVSPDGSVIVVNKADTTLVAGKPYVFCVKGKMTFKHWRSDPPRLAPFSTSPVHDAHYVKSKAEAEKLVVGRVKRTVLDL